MSSAEWCVVPKNKQSMSESLSMVRGIIAAWVGVLKVLLLQHSNLPGDDMSI